MIESIRALLQVQEIDGEIREFQSQLAEIERVCALAEKNRLAELEAVESARAPVEEFERQQRRLENELADLESNLARLEVQLYEVTSKQAFEGIQREIAAAKERKSAFEDEILECLESIDAGRARLAEAERARDEGVRKRAAEEECAQSKQQGLEAEVGRFQGQRSEHAKAVGATGLHQYDRMRDKIWPVAVVAGGSSCPGCRMVIAPQKQLEIKRAEEIVACLHCGRILLSEKALGDDAA